MAAFDYDKSGFSDEINSSSHKIVKNTIQDLFEIQQNALDQVRLKAENQKSKFILKEEYNKLVDLLENEKLDHAKTKLLLEEIKEKFDYLKNENEILRDQIKKCKEEYESKIKTLQNKTSRETKRCDFLIAKCSDAEREIEKQDDQLKIKDSEIMDLKRRIRTQKENHRHALREIDITKMQEDYALKALSDSQKEKM